MNLGLNTSDDLNKLKSVIIHPNNDYLEFDPVIPGSKSYTNRALILAGFTKGQSSIKGILDADDSYHCLEALKSLGAKISRKNNDVEIEGLSPQAGKRYEAYIGAAGTIARFLTSMLAASQVENTVARLSADKTMSSRPMGGLLSQLKILGGDIREVDPGKSFPIDIPLNGLNGGLLEMSGATSSQFVSGLLMAAPLARGDIRIKITDHIVQDDYVRITLDVMKAFGVGVKTTAKFDEFTVSPGSYQASSYEVEKDLSACCYFFAIAALTGKKLTIKGVKRNSLQPDIGFLDIVEKMGCDVEYTDQGVSVKGPETLKGGFEVSMKKMSDQALTLACLAVFANAPITITEVGHIRHHETDRIAAMEHNFKSLGVKFEPLSDGIKVYPTMRPVGKVETFHDHRVAMSFSLLGLRAESIEIMNPSCVAKTFPTFFRELWKTGVQIKPVPKT